MATPINFRKQIAREGKKLNLTDDQIRLLYILNGVESRSGTATENMHYGWDTMLYSWGGHGRKGLNPRSTFGKHAVKNGWLDKEGNIIGDSVEVEYKRKGKIFKKIIPVGTNNYMRSLHTAQGKDALGNPLDKAAIAERQSKLFSLAYDGRNGNNEPGDGVKYIGRGGVQLTGKGNYAKITKILNKRGIDIDLVKNPELAADERYSASILVAFAEAKGMFNPDSKNYISPEKIELIKIGDASAIDSLHNITNPNAGNESMTIQADTVFKNENNQYNITIDENDVSTLPDSELKGKYDDWSKVAPQSHKDGDIIKVGNKHYKYESSRQTYAPHDIVTGETEDLFDGSPSLINDSTVGVNPEFLPGSNKPNPDYIDNTPEADIDTSDPEADIDTSDKVDQSEVRSGRRRSEKEANQTIYDNLTKRKANKGLTEEEQIALDKAALALNITDESDEASDQSATETIQETEKQIAQAEADAKLKQFKEKNEETIQEEETIVQSAPQNQTVLGPDGEEITIPIGEDVEVEDLQREKDSQEQGVKTYQNWDDVYDDDNLQRGETIKIGENSYKWVQNPQSDPKDKNAGNYLILNEDGSMAPYENNEAQLIAQRRLSKGVEDRKEEEAQTGFTYNVQDDPLLSTLSNTDLYDVDAVEPETIEDDTQEEVVSGKTPGKSLATLGKGLLEGAAGVIDAIGGPGAIVSYIMGKKGLTAAMKKITPQASAELSPMFMSHLRQAKELSKKGFHPDQEVKFRKELDKSYQMGLENAVRGSSGQRARFLAQSGVLDAQRSSALLDYAVKDAELQSKNAEKYQKMALFKENFEIQQTEKERSEDVARQIANKKAASGFAAAAFTNTISGLNNINVSGLVDSFFKKQGSDTEINTDALDPSTQYTKIIDNSADVTE